MASSDSLPKAITHSTVVQPSSTPKPCSELFNIYVMNRRANRPLRIPLTDIIPDIERARILVNADAAVRPAGVPPKAVFMDRASEMVYIVDDEAGVREAL